jgi:hypothetical protein
MHNGSGIGFRNLPTPAGASGVWGVEEAFLADRDGVWPRWPKDAGIPINPDLAIWLEVDYGLYQDRAATIPAVNDGDPVRAWANRGYAGAVKIEDGLPSMTLRISGAHRWLDVSDAVSEVMPITLRKNTYVFGLAQGMVTGRASGFYAFAKHAPDTGNLDLSGPRLDAQTNSLAVPRASTSSFAFSNSSTATRFFRDGLVDFVYAHDPAVFFGTSGGSRVMRLNGQSSAAGLSSVQPGGGTAKEIDTGIRLFGHKNADGTLTPGYLPRVKAFIIYLTDIELTEAEMFSIGNTLAARHDAFTYSAEKWGL